MPSPYNPAEGWWWLGLHHDRNGDSGPDAALMRFKGGAPLMQMTDSYPIYNGSIKATKEIVVEFSGPINKIQGDDGGGVEDENGNTLVQDTLRSFKTKPKKQLD